jgi:hypothetical protein
VKLKFSLSPQLIGISPISQSLVLFVVAVNEATKTATKKIVIVFLNIIYLFTSVNDIAKARQ